MRYSIISEVFRTELAAQIELSLSRTTLSFLGRMAWDLDSKTEQAQNLCDLLRSADFNAELFFTELAEFLRASSKSGYFIEGGCQPTPSQRAAVDYLAAKDVVFSKTLEYEEASWCYALNRDKFFESFQLQEMEVDEELEGAKSCK